MNGRLINSYEPGITASMLVLPESVTIDEQAFAMMVQNNVQLYVIEDEQGIAAAATFTAPVVIQVVLAHTFWIREDLRGATLMLNDMISGLLETTGRSLLLSQVDPGIIKDKHNVLELPKSTEEVKFGVTPAYIHGGVFLHARA